MSRQCPRASAKQLCLRGLWLLRGEGGVGESIKKGKFVTKVFLQINMNQFLKNCKKS